MGLALYFSQSEMERVLEFVTLGIGIYEVSRLADGEFLLRAVVPHADGCILESSGEILKPDARSRLQNFLFFCLRA